MTYIKFLLILTLTFLSTLTKAQTTDTISETEGVDITVVVKNIRGETGKIIMGLYDSAENFEMRTNGQYATGTIENGQSTIVYHNVKPGTYAIKCYHDANDNNQIDLDGFIPVEDYGSTNNPLKNGPPTFKAAKFVVNDTNLNFDILF